MTQTNVLGGPLIPCSLDPLTGWLRNGCCSADDGDAGQHHVCAVMTEEFLAFTVRAGNDLVTARPEFGFPGLKPGDHWCLCTSRWEEARRSGFAPPVVLEATHARALEVVALGHLQAHAHDPAEPV
ncbi:MAG: DUF2237 family protein [Thermaurantiacus sp.]